MFDRVLNTPYELSKKYWKIVRKIDTQNKSTYIIFLYRLHQNFRMIMSYDQKELVIFQSNFRSCRSEVCQNGERSYCPQEGLQYFYLVLCLVTKMLFLLGITRKKVCNIFISFYAWLLKCFPILFFCLFQFDICIFFTTPPRRA